MKTIILAGGYGSRLNDVTEVIPKPMVVIGGKPMLWHIMKMYAHHGFNEFVICLGYKGEIIKDYFHNFCCYDNDFTIDVASKNIEYHDSKNGNHWKVTLADTGLETLKGGRIKRVEKYLDDEVNMLTYGDGVSDINIKELVDFHKSHGKAVTLTGVHPPSLFGDVLEQDNQITAFSEKSQASRGLINGGFMVFNKKMLDYLTEDEYCDFEFGALEKLVKEGQAMVYKYKGPWACIDTKRDLDYLNKLWKNKEAFWKVW